MSFVRTSLLTAALLALPLSALQAQTLPDAPKLRADVTVSSDIVRIGDVLENAGASATIAIYRAPDPGTTGALAVPALLNALRAHNIIGVETGGLRDVSVTRSGRTLAASEVETIVAQSLAQRMSVGDPAMLAVSYDREVQPLQLDVTYAGQPAAVASRVDPRGRFDITLEVAGQTGSAPIRLRFTGTVVETVETVVPVRTVERGETIKTSDVAVERRPRLEAGADALGRERAVGMQARRQLRAGTPLRTADLAKPDLVQRDQSVTLIYQTAGIFLTGSGKAMENGTEGDVITVTNLMSKRAVTGTVTGRGQVTINAVVTRPAVTAAIESPAPVAVAAANLPISRPAE